MPWTITRLCIDCVGTGCVSVLPIDCVYEYVREDKEHFPNMLYIHPEECIDCGAAMSLAGDVRGAYLHESISACLDES